MATCIIILIQFIVIKHIWGNVTLYGIIPPNKGHLRITDKTSGTN